jgi:hypothetical protein
MIIVKQSPPYPNGHRNPVLVEPLAARVFRLRIGLGYSVYELAEDSGVFRRHDQAPRGRNGRRRARVTGRRKSTRRVALPAALRQPRVRRTSLRRGTVGGVAVEAAVAAGASSVAGGCRQCGSS